jgi:3-oxoacyl-[acyl-carrier protein] reductase
MSARGQIESNELADRVAIVTGANHGIGAATAIALARRGAGVLVSFLRVDVPDDDPGRPQVYRESRARDGSSVVDAIGAAAGAPRRSRQTSWTLSRPPDCSTRPRAPSARSRS